MKRKILTTVATAALACFALDAQAQKSGSYGNGLRMDLDDEGDFYVRFLTWHQVWTRYIEFNPGTTVQGEPKSSTFDIALRRSRFLLYSALGPDLLILTHFGVDNQTFNGVRKPQLFMHDAWVQYKIVDEYLAMGFGLHYWHGVSRMTNASGINMLAVDAPILNWPTIEATDQFGRFIGGFVKGKVGGFDYRVTVNKPFAVSTGTTAIAASPNVAGYDPRADTINVAGYFQYQLLDRESNTLPYMVGTYLGSKRVLNVGAGFHWQPDALCSFDEDGREQTHDLFLTGLDVFYDTPLGENAGALTFYGVYYHYDFGPNNLRTIGIMNVGDGGSTINGRGNAYPVLGTGEHFYAQVGYLIPPKYLFGLSLQPYATGTVSLFEALDDPSTVFEAGANLLLQAHHAKFTLHWRSRPIFSFVGDEAKATGRGNEVILQAMLFL